MGWFQKRHKGLGMLQKALEHYTHGRGHRGVATGGAAV